PRDADLESNHDDDNNHHVVEEHDDVPPDHHKIQYCVRKIQLRDETNACCVSSTAFGNKCGRKRPRYETSAQERQVGGHIGLEYRRQNEDHATDERTDAQRRPERPKNRASVAPFDLLPAETGPDSESADPVDNVGSCNGVVWSHEKLTEKGQLKTHCARIV